VGFVVANTKKSIYDFGSMARAIKVVLALLCITCVLALCIAPWVDPPDTTLKSLQIILFLLSSFAACGFWLVGVLSPQSQAQNSPLWQFASPFPDLLLPHEANCVQQC